MQPKSSNVKPFVWNSKNEEFNISSLKELLNILTDINQEDIDEDIKKNIIKDNRLIEWLEINFPKKIELITHLKNESKEFTPQQIRERIIRDLKKIT
jgi:hypothetical protein